MTPFDAWHLPAIATNQLEIREHTFDNLHARVPQLTPAQLATTLDSIISARSEVLLRMTTDDIVAAIDAAARRLASPTSPEGEQARLLLPLATGYSMQTVEDVLEHMAADWRTPSLQTLVSRELPTPAEVQKAPALAAHVFSGNVPGVAVTAMIRSLLVIAATFGKTASGEPVLSVLFARALAAVDPDLARCVAVTYWPGGDEALEAVMLDRADALVIYGGAETIESLRLRAGSDTRVIVHGPRISFGIVGRDADASCAKAIACATAAYDQQGCVSPHAVFVERGGRLEPRELARDVAEELKLLSIRLPRRRFSPGEALAVRELRTRSEFRAIAGAATEVFGPEDLSFSVLYDDVLELPVSCLNRTLFIIAIDSFEQLDAVLAPHREILQSVALSGFKGEREMRLERVLVGAGVGRIATFEKLPWPPKWWHHAGSEPLRELLSRTDTEA